MEEDSGHILGAHLEGPHADEVINLFALAIRHDLTADDLKGTIFAYPLGASHRDTCFDAAAAPAAVAPIANWMPPGAS